ncbi:MAG: DNA polymerase III subunit alpha [Patescibacteria group bacterium]
MPGFVHLHVHSHYSLLDGLPKIPELISYAKKLGHTALAITDHGSMYGVAEFYKEARAQGIKPIIGVEAYLAPRRLTDKKAKIDDVANHLVLLAKNLEGYKNLLKLVSIAHLEGFYYKPRIDLEILKQHNQGIIALSACLKGTIAQAILADDNVLAEKLIREYKTILGEDNFYLEIQAHPELPEQLKVNKTLSELGNKHGIPLVATSDAHYLKPEDAEAQDIMVCVQTGRKVGDEGRLDMRSINSSFKTEQEMLKDLPDYPEAVEQTSNLAKKINLELTLGKLFFPVYPTPQGETPEVYLRLLTEEGLTKKYSDGVSEDVRERLEYELKIIMKKGYASYFLVVADFVNWARQHNIITTTRGSAAGSLVSFLLGITTINPLEYRLPFERFLNPQRPSPPDIDMDFADNRRDEVISYVTAKYGTNRVAQIVTFGTMMARAAVRDVGRALGYPYGLCDRVAKMIPLGHQGFHMTIKRALEENSDLWTLYQEDSEVKRLLDLAQKVEGCARHASVHAAGIVISPTPLIDYTPLQMDVDDKNVITQFDMGSCEDVGLVKMDFLGIRNLSILGSAVEIISKIKGVKINLDTIPLNDQSTFDLLAQGNTMGLFQLSSSGMTRYLTELKPTTIFDIMAMVALYRPGPINSIPEFIKRKHNPKLITYLDPRLKDILHASYGIITYQDDVLLAAIAIAGYTWEEADKLRKAMGKKIPKEMARQKEKFISGCISGGLNEAKAMALWLLIEPFAAYGFNKAHAASYAIVAYQTAYLKANYPTEFMAALMTAESDDLEKISAAVAECEKMNITILPPDINESLTSFTVLSDRQIRFGLNAMKNLGEQVAKSIIMERKQNGKFSNLEDFLIRTVNCSVTKKSLESLIKAGALDSLYSERRRLLDSIDTLTNYARRSHTTKETKQSSLFAKTGGIKTASLELEEAPPTNKQDKLSWEKEVLGLYVTEHPLADYAKQLSDKVVPANSINNLPDRQSVITVGMVTQVKQITTKNGDNMLFVTLEDTSGSQEIIVFPDTLNATRSVWQSDNIIVAHGRVSHRNGEIKIIVQNATILNSPAEVPQKLLQLKLGDNGSKPPFTETKKIISLPKGTTGQIISQLKQLLLKHPGDQTVVLKIPTNDGWRQIATPYRIADSAELTNEIKKLVNPHILS